MLCSVGAAASLIHLDTDGKQLFHFIKIKNVSNLCHNSIREETDLESCQININSATDFVKTARHELVCIYYADFGSD